MSSSGEGSQNNEDAYQDEEEVEGYVAPAVEDGDEDEEEEEEEPSAEDEVENVEGEEQSGSVSEEGDPEIDQENGQASEPEVAADDDQEPKEEQLLVDTQRDGQEMVQPNFEGLVSGALDGFGSGSFGDIVGQITSITGGEGGLSNALAGGTLGALASQLIASAAHHFIGINPETGRIIGAIAGNLIFGLGGRDNSLSNIGKLVLDQLISGRFQRPVHPFVSPRPGMPSFNLDFHAERDRCLRERRLFEDPEFMASDQSLYFSKSPPKSVQWRRPGELVQQPQLLAEQRASRFDVVQGQLGDCWLLAATANLTLREELFFRVVPPDQSFVENYAGIFHFQFWRYGRWVDVVIDDRLPTHQGQLLYMHSANGHSFWSALLEKAYAKLYGSYEALKGGTTSEALEDFTGGLIEHFELEEMSREQLLAILVRGFQMGSFFGCSIDADPDVTEAQLENGLVQGHAYSITALQTVHGRNGETVLLRVRNPWGEHEWNGAWSDDSPEWNYVSEADRQRMHLTFEEDGEFWMSLEDFHDNFQRVECCNLGPEVLDEICQMMDFPAAGTQQISRAQAQWTQYAADGEWSIEKGTAGGCRNYPTFIDNPQFGTLISVANSPEADGKCTLICAVLQKFRRELRAVGLDDLPIGFAVYPLQQKGANEQLNQQQKRTEVSGGNNYYGSRQLGYGPGYGQPGAYGPAYIPTSSPHPSSSGRIQRLGVEQFHGVKSVAKSPSFINLREVTARFRLPPGQYVIVPSTYEPGQEGQFLLRVFCSSQFQAIEL